MKHIGMQISQNGSPLYTYPPAEHDKAKEEILRLVREGVTVELFDGSGWFVKFLPPDGEKYITPNGLAQSGGRNYLIKYNAGMVPSWNWYLRRVPQVPVGMQVGVRTESEVVNKIREYIEGYDDLSEAFRKSREKSFRIASAFFFCGAYALFNYALTEEEKKSYPDISYKLEDIFYSLRYDVPHLEELFIERG